MKIIFATKNQGKVREIKDILGAPDVEVITMKEAGLDCDPDENGTTFAENALIKCRAIAELLPVRSSDTVIMSDDSGLVVDALGGDPGVHSARYLGYDTPYTIKNADIIARLDGLTGDARSARFACAVGAILSDGTELCTTGTMEGRIAYEPAGSGGFGYDPILYIPEYGCTGAELTEEAKNAISHRGKALRSMMELLSEKAL